MDLFKDWMWNRYRIIPCHNSDIHGNILGPKTLSFALMSSLYFVKPGEPLGRVWETLAIAPGYIAEYQNWIEELNEAEMDKLHNSLETMFSHCQCLPNSKHEGNSIIWEVLQGNVVLLENPQFYKLDSIGNTRRKHQTHCALTHTGKVALQKALLQLTGLSKKTGNDDSKLSEDIDLSSSKQEMVCAGKKPTTTSCQT